MFFFAVIAGVFSGISGAGSITLIARALNSTYHSPGVLLGSLAFLCFVGFAGRMAARFCMGVISKRATYELRARLARKILSAPLSGLEAIGTPRLLAALRDDVSAISRAVTGMALFCSNLAIVIAGLFYLAWLSFNLFLVAMGLTFAGILAYRVPMKKAVDNRRLFRKEQDTLFEHFHALTEGIKELKLHSDRREAFLTRMFRSSESSLRYKSLEDAALHTTGFNLGKLLYLASIGFAFWKLPPTEALNRQTLTGYSLIILFMAAPMRAVLEWIPEYNDAGIALERIDALGFKLDALPPEENLTARHDPNPSWEYLELTAVTYTYRTEPEANGFTFGPIDLAFRPGELIFLLGGNGSGKTTFMKILTGLYTPEAGQICLDGTPILSENMEWYRKHFSAVFQDFYLFKNLGGLNAPDLDSQVQRYLVRLKLDQKVRIRDGVLSTTTALSRGQRKRLALLVAWIEDRPIYIFDEWAADQDPFFKAVFYQEILPELKARGKTVLAITHDETYYAVADRLIKLDYGKLEYDRRITRPLTPVAQNEA